VQSPPVWTFLDQIVFQDFKHLSRARLTSNSLKIGAK